MIGRENNGLETGPSNACSACEWPVQAQRGILDHSPASSLDAEGLWQAPQYRRDISQLLQRVSQKENQILFIKLHVSGLWFECLHLPSSRKLLG